jgi:hypothetical protein
LIGRPDHLKSNVHVSHSTVSMDTITHATLVIELVDWQGTPLNHGGDQVIVTQKPGSTAQVSIGAPVDHNDGTYSVNVFAGPDGGIVDLSVVVDDGGAGPPITLYPHTRLTVVEPAALATIDDDVGYLAGEDVPLVFHGGPGVGGHQYLILASLTGTSPPIVANGVSVPLVWDAIFHASLFAPNSPVFVNTLGWLDAGGSTSAMLVLHPGQLQPYAGSKLHFSCVLFDDEVDYASPALSLDIVP